MDKYDKEIERLINEPDDLWRSWNDSDPLFQYVSPSNKEIREDGRGSGCLTMIRKIDGHGSVAFWPELTLPIRRDKRIPRNMDKAQSEFNRMTEEERREFLQPFAEWQRKIDEYRDQNEGS
jgi:hypothetical protein